MRILYVEDNPANLFLMQRIARMGGHEVISYTEGEQALERFVRDDPDLVLLDVQLAGALNGLDVVKILRERGIVIPVIAVTAYAMVGDKEKCLEAGFDGYMAKPLPVTELVELVQKYELEFKEQGRRAAPQPTNQTLELTPATAAVISPPAAVEESPALATPVDRKKLLSDADPGAVAAKKD